MQTISEQEADEIVKKQYVLLKQAFHSSHVPLFFTYIGPFPTYLQYITEQLVRIADDPRFDKLNANLMHDIRRLIHTTLSMSPEAADWFARAQFTPSFYNLERDLEQVYRTNITLALFFVGLRESVKGWAVAAKQLPSYTKSSPKAAKREVESVASDFVMEGYTVPGSADQAVVGSHADLSKQTGELELNLFPQYLHLQQQEFLQIAKTEQYLYTRVYIEKLILASIPHLPHPLISPVNVVLELTSSYKNFPDLLYLLSEHFPTLAVQRLIFSGYILS